MADLDYLFVLKALRDIPFGVGKKLLIDFLRGEKSNESIQRNRLFTLETFGSVAYEKEEIASLVDTLLYNGMISLNSVQGNKFWKVLELTAKGIAEIDAPSLSKKKASFSLKEAKTLITEQEKKVFDACGDFLAGFSDEQKKSIINNNRHILCVAGAGSGKTTVLAKRIEFLVNYRSIDPRKILAITFTRKARQEMMKKIAHADVSVETFNSFCEKLLQRHADVAYGRPVRVMGYKDKFVMFNKALSCLNLSIAQAIGIYFNDAQKRAKTDEQLANILMNDCFFIRDYFKFKNKPIEMSSFEVYDAAQEKSAAMVCSLCSYLESSMKKNGLRDFADQLVDALSLFERYKECIPRFEHVLIDEYQDVNASQIKLIDFLDPENVFAVGDPRQSIFGWRGSDIRFILNFEEKYPGSELILLTRNYRSTKHIVDLINKSIKSMGLADLESGVEGEKNIRLMRCRSEPEEYDFIVKSIRESALPRNEIFVLARTNRQLNELSGIMKLRGIPHIVRSDELKGSVLLTERDVTLATIHAIKGLEAHTVFVMGCTPYNFPCRGSEHPGIEMINIDEYDKEEEERRLLYVALSRAKQEVCLTYSTKTPTSFITESMLGVLEQEKPGPAHLAGSDSKSFGHSPLKGNEVMGRLKEWRSSLSKRQGVPAYFVMHDRTMIDLAVKMPETLEDLGNVVGIGPAKIAKYGEELLDIIHLKA